MPQHYPTFWAWLLGTIAAAAAGLWIWGVSILACAIREARR